MASVKKIKELRELTGAWISDCKQALTENDDDVERAAQWLKLRSLAANAAVPPCEDGPLIKAIKQSDVAAARALIADGADVAALAADGLSALYWAANGRPEALVELLLERGVDVNQVFRDGETALSGAVANGSLETVRLLLDAGASILPAHFLEASRLSDSRNRREMVRMFLDQGADVHWTDDRGRTALHLVRDQECAALLVERGAEVNRKDRSGNAPLHARADYRFVVDVLLRAGADASLTNDAGRIPLHIAVREGGKQVIEQHVEFGADLDSVDNQGFTPLLLALKARNDEAAIALIRCGADISISDAKGNLPADWAQQVRLDDVSAVLAQRGQQPCDTANIGRTHFDRVRRKVYRLYRDVFGESPDMDTVVPQDDHHAYAEFAEVVTDEFDVEPDVFHDNDPTVEEVVQAILDNERIGEG